MEQFKEDILQRVVKVEEHAKSNSHRINALEDKTKDMPKFEYIMSKFEESNKEFLHTLHEINTNLTTLNSEVKVMGSELTNLNNRVGKLEEDSKEDQIAPNKLIKQIIWIGIPGVILAATVYFLGFK